MAWPSLPAAHYVLPIPDDCLAELDRVLAELRAAPVPTLLLAPQHFALLRCTELMAAARERLDHGPGFVILNTGWKLLNNRVIVHGRSAYEDHAEPERRRHLVRLWLRAGDRRQFRG